MLVYDDTTCLPHKAPNATRFVCMSDTHTKTSFPFTIPDGDVFLHTGDLTRFGCTLHDFAPTIDWIASLPHKIKIVIAGNHDHCMDRENHRYLNHRRDVLERLRERGIVYLEHQSIQLPASFGGYNIFGSPYTLLHYHGAFMERSLEKYWQNVPDDTDILMVHGPPLGHLDLTRRGVHVGCPDLATRIRSVRPQAVVFGHIHESYGYKVSDGILYANSAAVNVRYKAHNPPIVFDLFRKSLPE
ncbi:Metallo-dependent phosphatase-like protein [Gongronella butleri]|nr:Metallo-dependent phosphatase-like protein [Gongronella butleri]